MIKKMKTAAAAVLIGAALTPLFSCAPETEPDPHPKYTLVIEQTEEYTSLQLVEIED